MINVVHQNLFSLDVDAIVNSANVSLLAGSGICGVIYKNAGRELEKYCKSIVIPPISTGVYRFPAKEAANIAISSVATALKVLKGVGSSQNAHWLEPSYFVFNMSKVELVKYLTEFEQTGGVWMDKNANPVLILNPNQ